ncbi:carboxypeptidase-like regulatory domain-containing protein [Paenibacillus glycinis]|uniref:Tetratricopeptide repeat protein n=1 Tax=Paenibacillus glycinis TaxID=2697035 RepID=A0ABW9XKH5_9BACL|nr:carboxypeptidase-like regulatory domain-containing protein [Paenibacillus glycinis]NBD23108.1 hypothetical protein [Paenibacillus glycinis]
MRLKIRVKVKHLVSGIIGLGLLFGAGAMLMPSEANDFPAGTASPGMVKSELLRALDDPKPSEAKWKLIQTYVLGDGKDRLASGYRVYVGSNFTTSGGSSDGIERPALTWEEKLPSLRDYLDNGPAVGTYLSQAAMQLALYDGSSGEPDRAIEALETAERRNPAGQEGIVKQLRFEQVKLLMQQGEYSRAEASLDEIDREAGNYIDLDGDVKSAKLKAQILLHQGRPSEAQALVQQAISNYAVAYKKLMSQPGDAMSEKPAQLEPLETLRQYFAAMQSTSGSYAPASVSGTVLRSNGEAMARVAVFLRTEDAVNHSVLDTEPYQTMTDDQGRYTFTDVLPGSYQLTIGFDYDQIDGWSWPVGINEWIDVDPGSRMTIPVILRPLIKLNAPVNNVELAGPRIDFDWEPVEGAAYYKLNGNIQVENGTIGVEIRNHITGHAWSAPVDTLYNLASGYSFIEVDGKEVPDPVSLLGFANPGKRFSWYVEAFDEQGNKLSQSNGYRLTPDTMGELPFFTLHDRTLSEGDRLLLAYRDDDALKAYKRAWAANPADAYSLGMIIRLYHSRETSDRSARERLDEETVPYVLEMMKLRPEQQYSFWLMNQFISAKDWSGAEQYYELGLQLGKDGDLTYVQSVYAAALMTQGRFEEAKELLAAVMPAEKSHRFVGHLLAADLLVVGSIEHATDLAARYPERKSGETVTDWSRLLSDLSREAKDHGSSVYIKELKQAMQWQYAGDMSKLGQWLSQPGRPASKAFLAALANID